MPFEATQETVTGATPALQQQFALLSQASQEKCFPSISECLQRLERLRLLLVENEEALCEALSADYGYRSAKQSSFAEITTTLKSINFAKQNLKFWMQKEKRKADLSLRLTGASCFVEYVPKGVVGIVSPWNFPINLSFSPLVSALAAGNVAFLKPSEATPAVSDLMKTLVEEYFEASEVAVVCGDAEVAKAFVELPFDHLIYTGGENIAKSIMASAAKNLVPLTLELGGKSPVIISKSADLKLAAKKLAFGKYFNAGQICIAPDYVLVAEEQLDTLIAELKSAVLHTDGSKGVDSVDVINLRHEERMNQLAASADITNVAGLKSSSNAQQFAAEGSSYKLTVLVNPPVDSLICQQEIFGPVLAVFTADGLEKQIEIVNSRSHPLVIYYFGKDEQEFIRVNRSTKSGAVVKNDIIFQYANDDLPFGGVGSSGMGRYRGIDGFKEFSNHRAIYKAGLIDLSSFVTPPYGSIFNAMNKIMRKL